MPIEQKFFIFSFSKLIEMALASSIFITNLTFVLYDIVSLILTERAERSKLLFSRKRRYFSKSNLSFCLTIYLAL